MNVLLIDDDPNFCELLRLRVRREVDCQMDFCESLEALRCIDISEYNTFITDYKLQREDGFQVNAYLNKKGVTSKVIMITGWEITPDIIRRAEMSGIDVVPKDPIQGLVEYLKNK